MRNIFKGKKYWKKYWKEVREQCSFCDKLAILICSDCNWEVCEDHSRKDGKCIYCTKIGVIINPKAIKMLERLRDME